MVDFQYIALAGTIFALTLAIAQTVLLMAHTRNLAVIRESLSTEYLGQFPDFLPRAIDLIDGARKKVVIVCDVPAYSLYSNNQDWIRYKSAIEGAISRDISVQIICLNRKRRASLHHEQFFKAKDDWNTWINNEVEDGRMPSFLKKYLPDTQPKELTSEKFVETLAIAHQNALSVSFLGAEIRVIDTQLPLYLWAVDDSRAVFSIPSFTENATEHGFLSSDQSLITAFKSLYERYQKTSELIPRDPDGTLRTK